MAYEKQSARYSFGQNWRRFLSTSLDEEHIGVAQSRLLTLCDLEHLRDHDVLDIGCGSGIHSLAALRAGARRIVSFDYDPDSIAATATVKQLAGGPAHWTVMHGDVLSPEFLAQLGQFSLVYSWGVLHHTGDVWRAFANAQTCVAPGGMLCVALYSADAYPGTTDYWLDIKRRYNEAGPLKRHMMEASYIYQHVMYGKIGNAGEAIRYIRNYKRTSRGMSFMTDIRDWLGGWPMEFVSDKDVIAAADLGGFKLIKTNNGGGNSEFLFAKLDPG